MQGIGQLFDHAKLKGWLYKTTRKYFPKSTIVLQFQPLLAVICMFIMYKFDSNSSMDERDIYEQPEI